MVGHRVARLLGQLQHYSVNKHDRRRWLQRLGLVLLTLVILQSIELWAMNGSQNPDLVDIHTFAPTIQLDLRYATTNNFTQQKLYPHARCLLRPNVAMRLAKVQADLEAQGLGLKVYDCYRPLSVQKLMWKIVPNPDYVANPKIGSRHNRGSAVDLTLIDAQGNELAMPSNFDEFSPKSHIDYQGGSSETIRNRNLLLQAMKKRGFVPLQSEWWHFDAPNWRNYELMDIPFK